MAAPSWFDNPRVLRGIIAVLLAMNTILTACSLLGRSGTVRDSLHPFPAQPESFAHIPPSRPTTDVSDISSQVGSAQKIAMIVETRISGNLIPLILHFSAVLGSSWQVVLFTMENMWKVPSSIPFQRAVDENRVTVQFMPPGTNLAKWKKVNWFFTRPWIWEQVQSAQRVLLFQSDSIICSNSNWTVDDFLEWDFIGAPVNPFLAPGYNGGLSLRNPKMILDILAGPGNDFDENWRANRSDLCIEDQWYYNKMKERPEARLPDSEVAKQFSTESYWYDRPLGFHKPRMWNRERMDEIWKYCPEVELIDRDNRTLEELVAETDLDLTTD